MSISDFERDLIRAIDKHFPISGQETAEEYSAVMQVFTSHLGAIRFVINRLGLSYEEFDQQVMRLIKDATERMEVMMKQKATDGW